MQQFEPLTTEKVASARSVSETNNVMDTQTQVQRATSTTHSTPSDAKVNLRTVQLVLQPVVAWICLMATAKATGQFDFAYRYPAQAQILLAVVPHLILLFVGLRLRNPRLAFVAGLLFATITLLSFSSGFTGLGFVSAVLMPFVAAGSAAMANRPEMRKRLIPVMLIWLASITGVIAISSGVRSVTPGVSVAEAPMAMTAPIANPPVAFRSENSSTMTIGNRSFRC